MAKPTPVNVGAAANDGNGDPLRSAFQTVNLAITDYVSKTVTTLQQMAGSLNFASGKGILYDGVPIEIQEKNTNQVTLTPATSGSITLKTANDLLSYTKDYALVTETGLIIIDSVSSPAGTSVTLGNLPFQIGSFDETSERIGVHILYNAGGLGAWTTLLVTGVEGTPELVIRAPATGFAENDQLYFSFLYHTSA